MIQREAAVRMVEEELERTFQEELSAGLHPRRMTVESVEQHELVWIVHWTSEEFVRTRKPEFILVGNGPYLVDRFDGSLHEIGVVAWVTGAWEADYRVRVRGPAERTALAERTAVDDLHDEVRAVASTHGRIHAMYALRRRLPVLSHAETIAYVTALLEDDAPEYLVEVATRELAPPPVGRVLSVHTIRGAAARGTH
ncbi:YrhB domain-containing protein [Streptomyces hirsutus]|uniref:YrhB domain-containing protein n=1 Tax=Streptomyces hirsutus TaxID=35620 RepID=UPI00369CA178